MMQVQRVEPLSQRVVVFSMREVWAMRYMSGPAACYCMQCESPGKPVTCDICSGTVQCA